jgi:hypothetical protein
MAVLISVANFREWTGAASGTVSDALIQACLDEAEAGLLADLGLQISDIQAVDQAHDLASGEELRRASRLLARRNSPEAISGAGEAVFAVPSRDPDSARTLSAIRAVLVIPEAIA